MRLGEPDERGRRQPVPVPGSEYELPADIVLVAIGEAPDPSFLPEGTSVQVAAWGGLLINQETLATGATGIFAAGDVTYGPKTIIHAAAHGKRAAQSIHAFLQKLSPDKVAALSDDEFLTASALPSDGVVAINIQPMAREEMPSLTPEAAQKKSVEFASGFTEEQAQREASRCLRCDLSYRCPTIHLIQPERARPVQTNRP